MNYFNINMVLVLGLLFCLGGCQFFERQASPEEEREAQLVEDVHRIHDVETMPKMTYIVELQRRLKALGNPDQTSPLVKGLERAETQMMDWMKQFNWPSEQMPIEERIGYYEDEVEKLKDLKRNMYAAIAEAEAHLEAHQPE